MEELPTSGSHQPGLRSSTSGSFAAYPRVYALDLPPMPVSRSGLAAPVEGFATREAQPLTRVIQGWRNELRS